MFIVKSRELIVCDHCEFVTHCDLRGPDDSNCPHHYELYTGEAKIMTVKIAEETNRIVKIQTPEREITVLLTDDDFKILEYAAYQLQIPLKKYLNITLEQESERIRRKYGL